VAVPPYPKYLMDRSSIQRVRTTKNAKGKLITEDYKNTEIRIPFYFITFWVEVSDYIYT